MTYRLLLFCFLVGAGIHHASAQRSVSLSLFNNASQLPPSSFSAVWSQPLHPGIAAGYEFHWKEESRWFQSVKVGFYYHQFVQSAIQLYTDFGYRKIYRNGLFWDASVSLGYLHAIALTDQAKLNANGDYVTKNGIGRAQVMTSLTPGFGYRFQLKERQLSVFTAYQIWLQLPFVPGYVPLLPNGSVHLGARLSINKKSK